jgi:hypothetical protein
VFVCSAAQCGTTEALAVCSLRLLRYYRNGVSSVCWQPIAEDIQHSHNDMPLGLSASIQRLHCEHYASNGSHVCIVLLAVCKLTKFALKSMTATTVDSVSAKYI